MAKIAIDIGHGSNTFPPSKGVYRNNKGYAEHDFNAKLGLRIKELLERQGHTVIFAQQPNRADVSLTRRTQMYNREGVDLIISIHANASSNSEVSGRCVFYWHTSTKGKQLAELIAAEIKAKGYSLHGNGLHASMRGSWTDLHITREPKAPSVLVEHGFMTNSSDFELIFGSKQKQYIEDMAEANVRAVQKYFGLSYKGDTAAKPKPTKKPAKPKSNPKIRTGGLNKDNIYKVTRWLKDNTSWYYTFRGSGGNNPVLITGGLNEANRAKFEKFLKQENLWYRVEHTSNHSAPTSNNPRVRTGGLSTKSAVGEVTDWLTKKGWYFVGSSTGGNNPVITTGGLSAKSRKEFTDFLDSKGYWYTIV